MNKLSSKFKKGDSVIVKKGVKEPDLEQFNLDGWQGRIVEIDSVSNKENILITIEWDSFTLKKIPADYIEQSEREGFDWQSMILYESDLEKTNSRDKTENVKQAQNELSDKYYWVSLGAEGERISNVIGSINPQDEMECFQKWMEYLDRELTFPVDAVVSDSEDNPLINTGDKVIIQSLPHVADIYGVIASIRLNGKKFGFPLCDLEVTDSAQPSFQLIEDYKTWFSNR